MMISGSGEEGQGIGDGFDVQYGGALELNNSNVTSLIWKLLPSLQSLRTAVR